MDDQLIDSKFIHQLNRLKKVKDILSLNGDREGSASYKCLEFMKLEQQNKEKRKEKLN